MTRNLDAIRHTITSAAQSSSSRSFNSGTPHTDAASVSQVVFIRFIEILVTSFGRCSQHSDSAVLRDSRRSPFVGLKNRSRLLKRDVYRGLN